MKDNVKYLKHLNVNDQKTLKKRLHLLALKRYDLSLTLKPSVPEPEVYDLTNDSFNGGF